MAAPQQPPSERHGWAIKQRGEGGKVSAELMTFTEAAPLGDDEVDVHVTHCGVCHTDVSMAFDAWKKASFPFVPGHEAVGIVAAVGRGVTRPNVQPGARVGVGYLKDSCGECLACLRGCENVCPGVVGTIEKGGRGGWADYVRAKVR